MSRKFHLENNGLDPLASLPPTADAHDDQVIDVFKDVLSPFDASTYFAEGSASLSLADIGNRPNSALEDAAPMAAAAAIVPVQGGGRGVGAKHSGAGGSIQMTYVQSSTAQNHHRNFVMLMFH